MNFPGLWNKPFNLSRFLLANIGLSMLILAIFMRGIFSDWKTFLISFLWAFSITFTQWGGLQLINARIDKKISWIEAPVKKTLIQIFVLVSYSFSAFILVQLLNFMIWMNMRPADSWSIIIKSLPYTLLISGTISLIFTAIGFFFAWKRSFQQAEQLKVEMLAYKYESLRNQINPHFLFNSLNVLSDLVYDDQHLAVKFIQQMSDLFRYVLDSRDKELVPLKDELDFIVSYTFMLKTRFEQKLIIDIDVQPDPQDYIVPMSLQLLIENAVKHNEISEAFPLHITVRKTEDCIEVENSLQLKKAGDDSKKTGLKNVTQQYAFFSEKPIRIFSSDDRFLVRLPILKAVVK